MPRNDATLRTRMKALAHAHKRYWSPRLHVLLKREGLVINHKRTERIYREEDLSLRKRTRSKRVSLPRVPMPGPSRVNEVWSIDFLSDALANGRRFRILAIVDNFTRVSPGILVDTSIPASRLTAFLNQIGSISGYPERIRADNGPEFPWRSFTSGQQWALSRLNTYCRESLLIMPLSKASSENSVMNAWMNTGSWIWLMPSKSRGMEKNL